MKQFFKSGLTAKWLLGRLLERHLNCLFGLAMSKATRQHVPPLAINRDYTHNAVEGCLGGRCGVVVVLTPDYNSYARHPSAKMRAAVQFSRGVLIQCGR